MTNFLVDLYLPALGEHFDTYLPAGNTVGEVTLLLIRIVESLSSGKFKGTSDSVLINANNGDVYDRNITVYDAGIRNASKLILI